METAKELHKLVNFEFIRKYDATMVYLKKGQALMAKQNYGEFVKQYLRITRGKEEDRCKTWIYIIGR